jgi:ADP-ribosylglycohydrolase
MNLLLAAIAGDIIGSPYEGRRKPSLPITDFDAGSRFTDDTVMTVAIADAVMNNLTYTDALQKWGQKYGGLNYGYLFKQWLWSGDPKPYHSFGNGSAMRVCPIAIAGRSVNQVLVEARRSAIVTHNHPQGVKGAQAVALAIFLAMKGYSKRRIKTRLQDEFHYDLDRSHMSLLKGSPIDLTCQKTVPAALISFLESVNYIDAVHKAVSIGGDTDTLGCITSAIAAAYYKDVPLGIIKETRKRLTPELRRMIDKFGRRYC